MSKRDRMVGQPIGKKTTRNDRFPEQTSWRREAVGMLEDYMYLCRYFYSLTISIHLFLSIYLSIYLDRNPIIRDPIPMIRDPAPMIRDPTLMIKDPTLMIRAIHLW